MAAEVLCTRWTMVLLRELVVGSTRFNDLRRGLPRMSPALLTKRLRDLEEGGVVVRVASRDEPGVLEYHLTPAGRDLRDIVEAMGVWGQHWVETHKALKNLDPSLLMWDMRRNLDPTPMPDERAVILFTYPEQPSGRRQWWLIVEKGEDVDLCSVDPGFDVDLYATTDLRTMTAIWMGIETVRGALDEGKMILTGDRRLANHMQSWLGLSPFAKEKSRISA
jgi:DNA-binding HxlR family transcriptional regulator